MFLRILMRSRRIEAKGNCAFVELLSQCLLRDEVRVVVVIIEILVGVRFLKSIKGRFIIRLLVEAVVHRFLNKVMLNVLVHVFLSC